MAPDHDPTDPQVRYRSYEEDSDRWARFPFREGDIVVSTRSKSGTTWMQQICLLLVHGTPMLPGTIGELSPWVDWLVEPEDRLFARLEAQPGRRVVKTHTPLDGVVNDPRATFVVAVRDPLDLAVSLYHQGNNIDRDRFAELSGTPVHVPPPRPPLHEWLVAWTSADVDRMRQMDSLQGVVHHTRDAWSRRDEPNVVLVRYEDLAADLEVQMRWLADRLGAEVPQEAWPGLVAAAGFAAMRDDAVRTAPAGGVLKDPAAFYTRGRPGAGREVLTPVEVAAYEARVRELVPEPEVRELLGREAVTLRPEAQGALRGILERDDPEVLAIFLSGSAARGMANEHSDVDVHLVMTPEAAAGRPTIHGRWADEITETLEELERPGALGTDPWWYRWTYAWVQVLRDETGGRLEAALRGQCTLSGVEQRDVLVDRLDGYVNFVFRALKADRDGRPLELRLDAAESVPWWLDTIFALAGRVRPYNKYLVWELRRHPLEIVEWQADALLPLVELALHGDPEALRAGFGVVERECRRYDLRAGGTLLGDTVDAWGADQLALMRG